MKVLRSIIGATLALGMVMALPVAASPVETDYAKAMNEMISYMYLNSATSSAEKNRILEARYTVIYGDQAWTVDNAVSVLDYTNGKATPLPDFYDLFPQDWDIPNVSDSRVSLVISQAAKSSSNVAFNGNVEVTLAAANKYNTPPFFRFTYMENNGPIGLILSSFPGTYYNAGFCNEDTGKGVGWCPGLEVGKSGVQLTDPVVGTRYGSIVSVDSNPAVGRVKQDYVSNFDSEYGWEDAVL